MKISLKETRLGLRNSTTRLPFRYGSACLTRCPQAVLEAQIEVDGRLAVGWSGDCLPPGWFDKSPHKDYATQIADMLAVIGLAQRTFGDELARPTNFFRAWLAVDDRVHQEVSKQGLPGLLAGFGVSLVERAVIDAVCRAAGLPFHQLVRKNALEIEPSAAHPSLANYQLADWLPAKPRAELFLRQTVGLADPLTIADVPPEERLDDGFPQTLEEYVQQKGICYFKIKLSNHLEHDVERLEAIAHIVEQKRGSQYRVTLDGNEQYKQAAQFDELVDRLRSRPRLATLLQNTLVIEQPLDRAIALDLRHTSGIRALGETIPVIIDESDGDRDAYRRAMELGYRGVSSKACKGAVRSLLNAGLTWHANQCGRTSECSEFTMTAEDLCSVGVIAVQSDLCLVATLGLNHIERNGHHYHLGLSYLPPAEQEAALQAHPDFYSRQHGVIAPRIVNGRFEIESLQCPGMGFAVPPAMESMEPAASWRYESLGLASAADLSGK